MAHVRRSLMLFSQKLKLSAGLTLALITPHPCPPGTARCSSAQPGQASLKPIPLWGLDTAWLNGDNVRRGALFMGKPQVDLIRFSFTGDWPLSGGDLGTSALAEFNDRMAIVNAYTDSHAALLPEQRFADIRRELHRRRWAHRAGRLGGVDQRDEATLCERPVARCWLSLLQRPDNSFEQGSVTRLGDVSWQLRNILAPNHRRPTLRREHAER